MYVDSSYVFGILDGGIIAGTRYLASSVLLRINMPVAVETGLSAAFAAAASLISPYG